MEINETRIVYYKGKFVKLLIDCSKRYFFIETSSGVIKPISENLAKELLDFGIIIPAYLEMIKLQK